MLKKNGMTQSRYNMCPLKERYSLSTYIWIPLSFMTLYRVPFLSALPFSHGGLRIIHITRFIHNSEKMSFFREIFIRATKIGDESSFPKRTIK